MPGKIKVKILAGRNLPVMDRSSDTTDAYVELKFGNVTYKTDVCRKSLNPQWNSEWYRFEVDDAELQDEPLQIRLMDHDTYSANDAIGKVYINLNPLLLHGTVPPVKNIWTLETTVNTSANSQGSIMTGWIPVYDTMHGIRGEVNIIIKVELFSDFNKFRQSSCGVQFFYSPNIPYGYQAKMIHGFVEELVVSDDPEYKWIDKIRTPRASNEARQTLFFKLSGEVQRKIGLKALDLGGNTVIGYLQNFDLEGESGIVARGIGTVVTLVKMHDVLGFPCDNVNIEESRSSTLGSRLFDDSDLTPPEFLIGETVRSLRSVLMLEDTKKQFSKDRLSKQIKHLRSKFDYVKENYPAAKSDRDSEDDPMKLSIVNTSNLSKKKNIKDTKSTGEMMAALLIGSIQNMPLDNITNTDPTSLSCNSEQSNDKISHYSRMNIGNNDKNQETLQSISSTVDSRQMPFFNDHNSTDDDLSDDATSYDILNNSICSLDKDSDNTEDSASLLITCSDTESQTKSILQIDSDIIDQLSRNTNLARNARLKKNAFPVDIAASDKITDSDTSNDAPRLASRLSIDDNQPNNLSLQYSSSASLEETDNSILKSIHLSLDNKQEIDYVRITSNGSSPVHRVHLTRHERDLCRARSQSAQRNNQLVQSASSAKLKSRSPEAKACTVLSTNMVRFSNFHMKKYDVSYKEMCAIANAERRKRMHELINVIDTKMMIPAFAMCRNKETASSTRESKKHKSTRKITNFWNLLEKFSSYNTFTKKCTSDEHYKEDVCHLPRIYSAPGSLHLFSIQYPLISSHIVSRSCDFLNSLTNDHTCVSFIPKQIVVSTLANQSDESKTLAKKLLPNSRSETDVVLIASNDTDKSINTNLTSLSSDTANVTIRRCNSVNSLKVFYHVDCAKPTNSANMTYNWCVSRPSPNLRQQDEGSISPSYQLPAVPSMATKISQSPAARPLASIPLHRRSSDSDLSVTPKGNSLGSSDRSTVGPLRTPVAAVRPMNQDTLEMLEYPFITMQHYPPGFILRIGGLVSSRSVKLLERISNLEEPESRDAWWTEIRMEVRSHARALACNVVIGYREETSICDDVCVLSAFGTAAVINFHNSAPDSDGIVMNKLQQSLITSVDLDRDKSQQKLTKTEKTDNDIPNATRSERQSSKTPRHYSESNDHEESYNQSQLRCNLCHLPYSENNVPFRINVSKCAICKRAKVPDVMFTTIEVPANIPITGRGCFIHAIVCKSKKDLRGELNAKEISDCLPFLEYELHSLLLNKLKVKGMNAIFGLRLQVSVGERLIIGMAVGTAVYLTALPLPSIPQIASSNSWHNEEQLSDIQKSIVETVKKNREFYHLKPIGANETENERIPSTSDTDDSDDDLPELDLGLNTRDTCVLEVDDIEDMDRISLLMANDRPPDDFHVVNTQAIPGLEDLEIVRNLQMFTQISRTKIPAGQFASMPSKYFTRLLQSLYFKLRRMVPCALCDMQFKIALSEQDEIQLSVIGMALGLGEPLKIDKCKRKTVSRSLSKDQVKKPDDSDMIFSLDEDHVENVASDNANRILGNPTSLNNINNPIQKPRPRSPLRSKAFMTHRHKHVPLKGRYGVDITPLSYLPGGRIERYQGNLNFFFIRESTSVRENGGLSGFTHSFVMEILAIIRAHITALGGNAMVAFFMTQCVLLHSPHKNQGQCLINVGGDVVTVSYYADEKHNIVSNC